MIRTADVRRLLLFVLAAGVIMFVLAVGPLAQVLDSCLPLLVARLSRGFLALLGQRTIAGGTSIYGSKFAIHITQAETLWFLLPVVLSFAMFWPARGRSRALIGLVGVSALLFLAVLRIVSIFVAGLLAAVLGGILHDYAWPTLLTAMFCYAWFTWWQSTSATDAALDHGREQSASAT